MVATGTYVHIHDLECGSSHYLSVNLYTWQNWQMLTLERGGSLTYTLDPPDTRNKALSFRTTGSGQPLNMFSCPQLMFSKKDKLCKMCCIGVKSIIMEHRWGPVTLMTSLLQPLHSALLHCILIQQQLVLTVGSTQNKEIIVLWSQLGG